MDPTTTGHGFNESLAAVNFSFARNLILGSWETGQRVFTNLKFTVGEWIKNILISFVVSLLWPTLYEDEILNQNINVRNKIRIIITF